MIDENKYGSALIYADISPWHGQLHETNMESMPLFHCGIVNYNGCNLCRYFTMAWWTTQNKYGSAVIYTVYFTVAWSTTRNKYGSVVIYAVYFTVAWLTTRNKYGVLVSFVFFL